MNMADRSSLMQSLRVYLAGWRRRWVRPVVWRRRLERLAIKRRQRARAWAHRSVSAFHLEPLESRILLAADLTGVIQSAVLPNPALEGTAGSALVQVVNQGNQTSNRMEVGVYISQNGMLDASDRLLGVATSGGGINAGKSKSYTVPFTISTQLDPGTYQLLAKVDHANATVENSELNNVAVGGAITVAWQFGNVPGNPGHTLLSLRDADGTRATFSLTGPGIGVISKSGSLWDIRLTGTDEMSALTITTDAGGDGRLVLNNIDVAGSLASFTAPTTDLLGAFTLNGPAPAINAGYIVGGVHSANAAPVAVADTASATEGGLDVVIDVLANDTDVNPGDTKTIVAVDSQGAQGTVSIAADGKTLVYSVGQAFNSLKAGMTATETFSYTMRDTAGLTSTAGVTVIVTGTNDGPVAVADVVSAQEDQSILVNILANDIDADAGETFRLVAIDRTGTLGSTAFASSGGVPMVYYTPPQTLKAGESAIDTFTYTIADSAGALSTATVTVNWTGTDDVPVAMGDSITVSEDAGPVTIDVLANDTDRDANDARTVTAVDGSGRPATWQLVIIYGVGAPITIPAIPAIRGEVSIAPDGQGVVYTPGAGVQSLAAGQSLTETIFYTLSDSTGALSAAQLLVNVTGANDVPTAVADQAIIGKNAAPVTVNVLANDQDPDAGDTKTIVSVDGSNLHGTVTLASGGAGVVYNVGEAFLHLQQGETATETFTYTIQDAAGAQSTATVTMVITGGNAAPVAVADTAVATENGSPVTIDVLANDLDPDASQTKTVVGINGVGLQGVASIAPGGTGVVYSVGTAFQQVQAGETATEQFTYTMRDSAGAESSAVVTVVVTGANDAPIAVADSATAIEDGDPVAIHVLANDIDVDAGDTRRVVSLNSAGLNGSVTLNEDGTGVIYSVGSAFQSLRAGATATDRFTYTMVDEAGIFSTATVSVVVGGANDGPVAAADTATVSETAAATTLAVLTNDTDPDTGDTKRVVSVDGTGLAGTVSVAANGAGVLYTPGAAFQYLTTGQMATETFTYTMQDGASAQSTASVTVTITGVTTGARANADTAVAQEDGGPIVISVLANDTNDANPGDLAIASIDGNGWFASYYVIGSATGNTQYGFAPGFPRMLGQASIAADGRSILYTPMQSLNAGEVGVDTFHYTLVGGATGVVTITVTGANDAPTAVNDSATVVADGAAVAIDVLANDMDPDTRIDPPLPPPPSPFFDLLDIAFDVTPVDVPDTRTVIAVDGSGLQGSVAIAAGSGAVTYTAGGALLNLAFGQVATETFTYTMQDALGLQSTASVTVTVTGTNQAPVAAADSAAAVENGAPVTIDVLANDGDPDSGSGDSISLVSIDASDLQGTVTIQNGSLLYTVGGAFQGLATGDTATETFAYTIQDSAGLLSTGTVTVTVTGVNDGPVAAIDGITISEDAAPVTINVLQNDSDADIGDGLTIVGLDTTGLQGTATISADGYRVIYSVGQAFQYLESGVATETFSYTVRDDSGALSSAQVRVIVLGAPEAPPSGSILGTSGDDIIDSGDTGESIFGQAGNDEITANGGADSVFGGAGRDTIDGGAGNDILSGGADRDDLTGGAGADTFQYALVSDSTATAQDRIDDFSVAEGDRIDLSQIDANTSIAGNNVFVINSGFTGIAGQLVLTSNASGYLAAGDVNGDSLVDFQIEIRTDDSLTAGNFIL